MKFNSEYEDLIKPELTVTYCDEIHRVGFSGSFYVGDELMTNVYLISKYSRVYSLDFQVKVIDVFNKRTILKEINKRIKFILSGKIEYTMV